MAVTYEHDEVDPSRNPEPPSNEALSEVGRVTKNAAHRTLSPLTRGFDIMGFKLSPSPELHGGGWAVLDVDYADGQTRTFDVSGDGNIYPRRVAFAFAAVVEVDADQLARYEDEEDFENEVMGRVASSFGGSTGVEFCSTPERVPFRPRGDYSVGPVERR